MLPPLPSMDMDDMSMPEAAPAPAGGWLPWAWDVPEGASPWAMSPIMSRMVRGSKGSGAGTGAASPGRTASVPRTWPARAMVWA